MDSMEILRIGYGVRCLEMEASLGDDGNIHLSILSDMNMGDEDGFGVEPDEYLVGTVSPMGTIIKPLHIE